MLNFNDFFSLSFFGMGWNERTQWELSNKPIKVDFKKWGLPLFFFKWRLVCVRLRAPLQVTTQWNYLFFKSKKMYFHVQYDSTVQFYGSTQRQSKKRASVFENNAWSKSMIWIVLHSHFLLLNTTVLSADWISMLIITGAMISRNSVLFYCKFMP